MELIFISGKSGVGKDTFIQGLDKSKYNIIIPYTTRPMRDGEENGKEYNFITEDQLSKLIVKKNYPSSTEYKVANGDTWTYITFCGQYKDDMTNIIIATPEQIDEIKWYFNLSEESGDEIINIYLETPPTDRIIRMLKRTDNDIEKINEVIRRFNADEEDFKEFENSDSIKKVVSNYIYYKIDNKTFWGSQEILKYIEKQKVSDMTTKVIKFENGNVMKAIGDDVCTKRSSRARVNSNNNILTCIIFSSNKDRANDKLDEIIKEKTEKGIDVVYQKKDTSFMYDSCVLFNDNELWKIVYASDSARGCKWHKAWVDKEISKEIIQNIIEPTGIYRLENYKQFY